MKEENFTKAMHSFFNKFEYQNATMEDIMLEFQNALDRAGIKFDLKRWQKDWL